MIRLHGFVLIMGIVGVVFPIGTSVLGFWYSGVRMIYAMGRQNFLPKQFSYIISTTSQHFLTYLFLL
ncbi:MAG: hypothetical protein ACLT33_11545 [Lachnospira pectinoschiza]